MLTWLVLVSARGPLDRSMVDGLGRLALDDLLFVPTAQHRWWSGDDQVAVMAWERPSLLMPVGAGWHELPDGGLRAISGLAVGPVGPSLDGRARAREGVTGAISTSVDLDRGGRGEIRPDATGGSIVYRSTGERVAALSNRASLCARIARRPGDAEPERDVDGLGWLLAFQQCFGRRTGFSAVEALPRGHVVWIAPGAGQPIQVTNPVEEAAPAGDLDGRSAVDRATASLVAAVGSLADVDAPKRLGLTGGRDSRLVLALLVGSGLVEHVTAFTSGPAGSPDVVLAGRLAAAVGIPHEHLSGGGRGTRDETALLRAVSAHVFRSSGMHPAAELRGETSEADFLFVDGLFGECLRAFFDKAGTLEDPPAVSDLLRRRIQRSGRKGGLLRTEVEQDYLGVLQQTIDDYVAEGTKPSDTLHRLYTEQRAHRWAGTEEELNPFRPRFHPLHAGGAWQAARSLGADGRRRHLIHDEIIQRLAPALVDIPYAEDLQPPARGPLLKGVPWSEVRVVLQHHLMDDEANPVFELLDRGAAQAVVSGEDQPPRPVTTQLINALGVAIWMRRGELRARTGDDVAGQVW